MWGIIRKQTGEITGVYSVAPELKIKQPTKLMTKTSSYSFLLKLAVPRADRLAAIAPFLEQDSLLFKKRQKEKEIVLNSDEHTTVGVGLLMQTKRLPEVYHTNETPSLYSKLGTCVSSHPERKHSAFSSQQNFQDSLRKSEQIKNGIQKNSRQLNHIPDNYGSKHTQGE